MGDFRAKFDTCEANVLSPPPPFVSGELTVNIMPYKSNEWVPGLLEEIFHVKELYRIYQCGSPTWLSDSVLNCDKIVEKFSEIFKPAKLNNIHRIGKKAIGLHFCVLLSERPLDTSEVIWNVLKESPDKPTFEKCIRSAFDYLRDKPELIFLSTEHQTQLASKLRELSNSSTLPQDMSALLSDLGIETLIEVGLHKLIADCIYLLETFISDSSPILQNYKTSVKGFENQWDLLHSLYVTATLLFYLSSTASEECVSLELSKILSRELKRNEWQSAMCDSNRESFSVYYTFSLPVTEFIIPLSEFSPDLWIMRIDAKVPVATSIRLVYELVTDNVYTLGKLNEYN
ncbi:unnamed protein product [Heterobilharzia americana]|nr:unnamed protein product [Heterobilharzia americana]